MEVKKYSLLLVACVTLISVILILNSASHLQIAERSLQPVDEDNGRREIIKIRQHNTEIRNESTRIVYAWDSAWQQNYQQYIMNFSGCEYSNCILQYSDYPEDAMYADIVIVDYYTEKNLKLLKRFIKQDSSFHTVWLVYGHESPGYSHNRWKDLFNDFDGAITYTRDALVFHPYGRVSPIIDKTKQKTDYAANKTRGAFAYVSNCGSRGYDRLDLMMKLGQYIDVDIFGGCTGKAPCGRGDYACEHRLHSQYHFYLSFENSLCKDYITEKFWKVLNGDGYYIPVALGGLTLEDYTAVAPPDSFLHVYNFTSIEKLGRYMKELTQDYQALNRYNHWRESYEIKLDKSNFCNLCKIANFPAKYKAKHSNIADKFNDPLNCKNFK